MCDIEFHRRKIDATIVEAIEPFRFSGAWNEAMPADCAVASLSDRFGEACIRARCEIIVAGAV